MVRMLALLCAMACSSSPAAPRGSADEPAATPTVRPSPTPETLIIDADTRQLSAALVEALASTQPDRRRLAMLLTARLHDPRAIPRLRRGLRDPDAEVRRNASLGLGALEAEGTELEEIESWLLGALAAEREHANRAVLLRDLGRVGGDAATNAFRQALASEDPDLREAACAGLAGYGSRRLAIETALLRRLAARARDDSRDTVRAAFLHALVRLPPPPTAHPDHAAVIEDLLAALQDDSPEARAMAARALSGYEAAPLAPLVARLTDTDWQVVVQLARLLSKRGAEVPLIGALRTRLDALNGADPTGPTLHVLLTLFAALEPMARSSAVYGVAQEALAQLGEAGGRPLSRDRGLAHCAAAKLVDLGRGWPGRVLACGLEQVLAHERQVLEAEILAEAEGSEVQRVAYLERLYRSGHARVQMAVLASLSKLPDEAGTSVVLEGLASDDVGVVVSALEAVVALAPKWREVVVPRAYASVRPAGAPAPPAPAPASLGPSVSQLDRRLRAAWEKLVAGDDLEGLQSWMAAVGATESAAFATELDDLMGHHNVAVRARAREVATRLGRPTPAAGEREIAPPPNPIAPDALGDLPSRASLETVRGVIEIELDTQATPTTVARFASLARRDYFDGLTFHRVVPAFVVQGGDPRGDGYGGPGWSQRCEDVRTTYGRGTVGMALAGRDTGGSQFFITHGPQPHLDGRYTAFGRVVAGMEVVDQLQAGDQIQDVRLHGGRAAPAP